MSDRYGAVMGVLAAILIVMFCAVCVEVGERAPSPSSGVATATPAGSETAPARPLETGARGTVGGDGDQAPLVDTTPLPEMASGSIPAPASTVTTQALVASPSATAYTVIDAVPATPVATARPVETIAPDSSISALVAASPWPEYLWGVVACLVERESRGVATAVGLAGERGLIQIHPITWPYLAQYGIAPDALFDPATNLRAGYLLFIEAGGLRPWGGGCA